MTLKSLLLALLLALAYSLLTAPQEPARVDAHAECSKGRDLLDKGLYGDALAVYEGLAKQEEPPTCALQGLVAVAQVRCLQAEALTKRPELADAAQKLYETILLGNAGLSCPPGLDVSGITFPSSAAASDEAARKDPKGLAALGMVIGNWFTQGRSWVAPRVTQPERLVLAGIALVLLMHVLSRRNSLLTPQIEVGPLKNASGDQELDASADGLTALLRSRLWMAGLAPVPLPGAGSADSLVTVIEESPITQSKFVAALYRFLNHLVNPPTGYRAEGTLLQREDGKSGVSIVLTDIYRGRTEEVISNWRSDHAEAIDASAGAIYEVLTSGLPRKVAVPGWLKWSSPGKTMPLFYKGKEALEDGRHSEALEFFNRASNHDPVNAVIAMERAQLLQITGEHYEALGIYLNTSKFWPDMVTVRYRLAATCGSSKIWATDWDRVKSVFQRSGEVIPEDASQEWMHRFAVDEYDKTLKSIERRVGALMPRPKLFWRLLLNLPSARFNRLARVRRLAQMRPMVAIAKCCTEAQLGETSQTKLADRVKRQLRKRMKDWQAEYNAACFFSITAGLAPGEPDLGQLKKCLEHLHRSIEEPTSRVSGDWLCEDPDLKTLRDHDLGALLSCDKISEER